MLERFAPTIERDTPREQASEPGLVGASKRVGRHLVVPAVGIDNAKHDVVVAHHDAVEAADVEVKLVAGCGDDRKTKDPGGCRDAKTIADDGQCSGAFHDYIG